MFKQISDPSQLAKRKSVIQGVWATRPQPITKAPFQRVLPMPPPPTTMPKLQSPVRMGDIVTASDAFLKTLDSFCEALKTSYEKQTEALGEGNVKNAIAGIEDEASRIKKLFPLTTYNYDLVLDYITPQGPRNSLFTNDPYNPKVSELPITKAFIDARDALNRAIRVKFGSK